MKFKSRELRRLWDMRVYDGDPDDPKTKTKKETVVAMNEVDANRRTPGSIAEPPVELTFVTWPEPGEDDTEIFEIHDTSGPTNKKVKPTIPIGTWD